MASNTCVNFKTPQTLLHTSQRKMSGALRELVSFTPTPRPLSQLLHHGTKGEKPHLKCHIEKDTVKTPTENPSGLFPLDRANPAPAAGRSQSEDASMNNMKAIPGALLCSLEVRPGSSQTLGKTPAGLPLHQTHRLSGLRQRHKVTHSKPWSQLGRQADTRGRLGQRFKRQPGTWVQVPV